MQHVSTTARLCIPAVQSQTFLLGLKSMNHLQPLDSHTSSKSLQESSDTVSNAFRWWGVGIYFSILLGVYGLCATHSHVLPSQFSAKPRGLLHHPPLHLGCHTVAMLSRHLHGTIDRQDQGDGVVRGDHVEEPMLLPALRRSDRGAAPAAAAREGRAGRGCERCEARGRGGIGRVCLAIIGSVWIQCFGVYGRG